MANVSVLHRDFYVYALFREDGETPFYIGKGRGSRMHVHERSAHRFASHKDRIIQSMMASGVAEIPKSKLAENLSDDAAKQIERDLIQLIGRWPDGPLANLTRGGDGVSALSESSRQAKSRKNIVSWNDPIVRAKRSAGIRAAIKQRIALRPPRERKRRPGKGPHVRSQEERESHGKIIREFWRDPEWRERQIAERKSRAITPAAAQEGAARLNSREALAKRRATNLLPHVREKRVAAQKAAFSTPEAKARRSEASKKMWARKKDQYALPSESANDPAQPPPQHP